MIKKLSLFFPLIFLLFSCNSILNNNKKQNISNNKPLISLVFYDASQNTYNTIKSLSKNYSFEATAGIVVSKIGTENYLTWDNLNKLQNSYNWEIASQTYRGDDLEQFYNDELRQEINMSLSALLEHNLKIETIVIPNADISVRQQPIINEYFKNILFPRVDDINSSPLLRCNLWSCGLKKTTSLEDIKNRIALCKERNEKILILVINNIDDSSDNEQDITSTFFYNLLQYLSSNNYKILNLSKAVNKILKEGNYE